MRWLLVFVMMAQSASAHVLIQAPESSDLDYRAALKADPDKRSPSQYIWRARPQRAQREALLNAFAEAQKYFLENSKDQAIDKFEALAAMLVDDDWSKSDRQVFLHSFLRLAQLQLDAEKQNYWLSRALLAGEDLEPETALFPPPLLRQLKVLRTEIPRLAIPERWWEEGWSLILLNGSPCTRQHCPGWPQVSAKTRITLLSDKWQPVTLMMDAADFGGFKPRRTAWASGDCQQSVLAAQTASLKKPEVFWSLDCAQKPVAALDLNPVATPVVDAIPRLEIQEKSPAFYKSKWFWAGVGVVAAALVIAGSKQKEEKEPTTTYGY